MAGLDSENSDAKKDKERKLQEFGTGRFGIDVLGCLGMLGWDFGMQEEAGRFGGR